MTIPVTCPDYDAIFDAADTTEDDYDETWVLYELYNSTVGA